VVSYSYDLASRLIGVSDTSAALAVPSGSSASYATSIAYDQINRTIGVNWSPAPAQAAHAASSAAFTFGYDGTNRRISQAANDNSWWNYPTTASSVSYIANNLNQYTAVGAAIRRFGRPGPFDTNSEGHTRTGCVETEARMEYTPAIVEQRCPRAFLICSSIVAPCLILQNLRRAATNPFESGRSRC
jgi:hypothetical protein